MGKHILISALSPSQLFFGCIAEMDSWMQEGNQHFSAGRYFDASEAYTKALGVEPKNAKALSNRSACFAKMEKFELALEDSEAALRADPSFTKAHGRRAAALQGLKRYEESAEAFTEAQKYDPGNSVYTTSLQEVKSLISQGMGIASKQTKDRYYLEKSLSEGKQSMIKGELHEAIRHFTRAAALACEKREKAIILSNRSAAWYRLGQWKESLDDANQALEIDSEYGRGYLRRAMSLHRLEALDDAKKAAEMCLNLDAQNDTAKEELNSICKSIEQRDRSTAKRIEEEQRRAETIAEERMKADATTGGMRRQGGPAYATTCVYCSYCNAYGHDRSECPLMRQRKRTRE